MYPFHSESERNYYALVGLYVKAFSGLEFTLYNLIQLLSRVLDDPKLLPSKSISLTRKISILRNTFELEALLLDEKEEMLAVLRFVEETSELRHNLVHGVNRHIYKPEKWFTQMYRPEQIHGFPNTADEITVVTETLLREEYEFINNLTGAIFGVRCRLFQNRLEVAAGDT